MVQNLTKEQQKQVEKEVKKQVHVHVAKELIEKTAIFGTKFKEQTATALIAAFGLLIALSWKDVVAAFIDATIKTYLITRFPSYVAILLIAVIVTALAIICIALISYWAKQPTNPENKIV